MGRSPTAFAPTELFVVLLSAYFSGHEHGFTIIVPKDISVSAPVAKYVSTVGGRIITVNEAKTLEGSQIPSHLWVHSFGKSNVSESLIERFNCECSLYADGIKNELGKAKIEESFPDYKGVLFFGFVWKKPFVKNDVPISVCTFQDIVLAFKSLKEILGAEFSFNANDLKKDWLFLRYWGQGPGAFVDGLEYSEVIKKYLIEKDILELVLKGDSRIKSSSTANVIKDLESNYNVVALEDGVKFSKFSSIEADKFFAEAMIPDDFSGRLHSFDSSLSVYTAVTTNADIQFPDEKLVKEVFENTAFAKNVVNYTELYRSVCIKIRELKDAGFIIANNVLVVEKVQSGFIVREANLPHGKLLSIQDL